MIRKATAMKVRQNLGELLSEVQYRKAKILITKAGKPVAAIVDIALLNRIRKLDEEFEKLTGELAKAFAGMDRSKGAAVIAEAVAVARGRSAKK